MEITTEKKTLKTITSDYAGERQYVSVEKVRQWLEEKGLLYKPISVKQELNNLKRMGTLFDAGRGWYSTLPEAYSLDTRPLEDIHELIRDSFPLLPLSCWTNRQLISHYHHLPTKYVTFIYLERWVMEHVRDILLDNDYPVYWNPTRPVVDKTYTVSENNVVLRPTITEEPVIVDFATVEKILVDLYVEKDKLYLMDEWEYQQIFYSITECYRINLGCLLRYSQRRKVKTAIKEFVKPLTQPK